MTEDMIEKAIKNAGKLNYKNVEFVMGEIEDIPLSDGIADVVISNCVLNLVPDKTKAFNEIYRILKNGGHFCVSDVVLKGRLPDKLQKQAELYTGCISGALQMEEYLSVIRINGFSNVEVKRQKQIDIPDEELLKYISQKELSEFRKTGTGIFSITVYGDR
jgi:ubiquinone/menaquinone biosynthesis C-methylase UbiE